MLKPWEFWVVTVVAAMAAVLAGINIWLYNENRHAQVEINERAQFIQQSVQLEGLYRDIVKALADLSVRGQDSALRDLLSAQGITVKADNPPAAAPAAGETRKSAK
jgi:type VI protein secretion system component VasK